MIIEAHMSKKRFKLNVFNVKTISLTNIVFFLYLPDMWIKKLEDYGPWFAEQEAMKTNEALRPGKPKTQDDLFGLDGSFRQLSID